MTNKVKTFIGKRIIGGKMKYYLDKDDFLVMKNMDFFVGVQPSFTIIEKFKFISNQNIIYGTDANYEVRVRCDITRLAFNNYKRKYEKEIYKRDVNSTKTYHLSNDFLNEISKLQSFIKREIEQYDLSVYYDDFTIDFSKMDQYIVIENPKNYSSEQLRDFLNMIDDTKELNIGNSILMIKALTNFKKELISVLNGTEHEITAVFKKYKSILSVVLLGINVIPIYGKRIETENYDPVIPDISLFNEGDESIYLIELKKATDLMFNDSFYRNNTLKIKPNFSNAIHQTNIQRNLLAVQAEHYYETIPKSVLIYGHLNEESKKFKVEGLSPADSKKIILQNLNIIRHNNKDIIILTYDEFINRIEVLINNSSVKKD